MIMLASYQNIIFYLKNEQKRVLIG